MNRGRQWTWGKENDQKSSREGKRLWSKDCNTSPPSLPCQSAVHILTRKHVHLFEPQPTWVIAWPLWNSLEFFTLFDILRKKKGRNNWEPNGCFPTLRYLQIPELIPNIFAFFKLSTPKATGGTGRDTGHQSWRRHQEMMTADVLWLSQTLTGLEFLILICPPGREDG